MQLRDDMTLSGLNKQTKHFFALHTENFRRNIIVYKIANEVYQDPILSSSLLGFMQNGKAIFKQAYGQKMAVSNSLNYTLSGPHPAEKECGKPHWL